MQRWNVFICLIFSALTLVVPTVAAETKAEDLYLANCSVCHRPGGEGIENIFPSLLGNAYVLGDAKIFVATVLDGRGGMPSFRSSLNDLQLTAIVNYVRVNFANQSDTISPELVNKIRNSGSSKITSDHDVQ